ncbi:MAG TPA: hypothetical protein VMF50_13500 [Candidatus Binataceae bacterium]|nr:hypothetical protein [Candidatus Binataceae bacterium]
MAGALTGRKVLAKLVDRSSTEPERPEPVFLDFKEVDVATASFLRESVLAFRDTIRRRRSNLYPVIANANDVVTDELKLLVTSQGNALMACSLDNNDQPFEERLLGDLDPKQRLTFDLVRKRGITDAAELMREYGEREKTKVQTAWNNRLSSLAGMGLVVELSQGRTKRYRYLFAEN